MLKGDERQISVAYLEETLGNREEDLDLVRVTFNQLAIERQGILVVAVDEMPVGENLECIGVLGR